jgi:curli production assembly/transport component CsgE
MRWRSDAKHCLVLAVALVLTLAQAELLQAQPALLPGAAADSAPRGTGPGADQPGQRQALQDLDAGVVVNQTLTMVGQDFYQSFVAAWRDKPLSERYSVSVHEWPSARLGSQVWVEYANRRVFQTFLPPARARLRQAAQEAVEVVYQNIVEADVLNLLFRDPDLGPDELKN